MKQKFFLMIALLLVASQGFAQHGSWSILPGQIDNRENLGSDNNDGANHSDSTGNGGFDGMVSVSDLIVPGNTEGTTSSGYKYIKVTWVQKGVLDKSDDTWYAPGGYFYGESTSLKFIVETNKIKKYTLQIKGASASMFSLDEYSMNGGTGKATRAFTLTYRLTKPGVQQIDVVIKEKGVLVPKTYTLRVACQTLMYSNAIPNPNDDGDINRADDAFEMAWSKTCDENELEVEASQDAWSNAVTGVDEVSMDMKVYADGQNIVIESPVAQSAVISDIAGRAQRVALQEGLNVIPAGGTGIHIVRVGEKTAKLMIR